MDEIKVAPVRWYRRKAWFLRNFGTPGFLIGAPVAYVLGIVTMLPMGWELGENATTMIAAGVTSLAAVGGAIAVWHYQQDQESTATGRYVRHVLGMPLRQMTAATQAVIACSRAQTPANWERLDAHLVELNSLMSRVSSSQMQRDELLLKLDPRAMEMMVHWLQLVLRRVNGTSHDLRKLAARAKLHQIEPNELGKLEQKFVFHVGQYKQFTEQLERLV